MTQEESTRLIRNYERLRDAAHELNEQINAFEQRLASICRESTKKTENLIADASLPTLIEAIIPTMREAIRQEIKAMRPLDEPWYDPTEIEVMSCGRVKADTIRRWLRWGQIDGESDGRQIRIYQNVVEELRKNKWRPLRGRDPSKLCPSQDAKN